MADDGLSKKLPRFVSGVQWPQTFDSGGKLRIGGVGSAKNYIPTPRQRLVSYLNEEFYGDDREGQDRAENIVNYLDVTPLAVPNAAYDATRAIGEERYADAVVPGITAAAPFLGKPTRKIVDAIWGKHAVGRIDDAVDTLPRSKTAESTPGVDDVKQNPLFDPPDKPQRPFEDDYTKGVKDDEVDEAGNLLVDMDGDPFIAKYKVGRLTKGGEDVGLKPDQYKALIEELIGKKIEFVPRARIGGSSGRLDYDSVSNEPKRIRIANDITKKKRRNQVILHEGSHGLHVKSGRKPADPETTDEMERNFTTLATGDENFKGRVLPSSRGYSGEKIEYELIAEAFRAAVTNPNYMKTVAPKTYATLRKWIKSNPELAKLIQFNSVGAAIVGPALGGQSDEANAAEAPGERESRGVAKVANTLFRRGYAPQTAKNGKFENLVQTLADLEARRKAELYRDPR